MDDALVVRGVERVGDVPRERAASARASRSKRVSRSRSAV